MKTPYRILILLALLATLPSCSSTPATSSNLKPYPMKTCIVTDNALGSMGDIITTTHGDQEIKFCCKPCVKKFAANPDKYLRKIR